MCIRLCSTHFWGELPITSISSIWCGDAQPLPNVINVTFYVSGSLLWCIIFPDDCNYMQLHLKLFWLLLFLKLIQIYVQVSANGNVLRSEIVGSVKMRVFLSGMPELRLGLNDKVLFESTGRESVWFFLTETNSVFAGLSMETNCICGGLPMYIETGLWRCWESAFIQANTKKNWFECCQIDFAVMLCVQVYLCCVMSKYRQSFVS